MRHTAARRLLMGLGQRIHFLATNRYLDFSERLRIVGHARMCTEPVVGKFLLKRLVDSGCEPRYFAMGRHKIYFEPSYEIGNPDVLLKGVLQVLMETFLFPSFFFGAVRPVPGDVVFDLGASIGTTALLFSELVGAAGKVFAVEPVTADVIRANLSANCVPNVVVIPLGVSDSDREAEIEISDFCLDSSIAKRTYTEDYYSLRRRIRLTTLDRLVEELGVHRVDFVKMDIEGAEEEALRGARAVIEEHRPKWSISSYHIDATDEPQHPKLVRFLTEHGYTVHEESRRHIFAW